MHTKAETVHSLERSLFSYVPVSADFLPLTGGESPVTACPLYAQRVLDIIHLSLGGGDVCVKLRIELSDDWSEEEVIIRCGRMSEEVAQIQAYIQSLAAPKLRFYKGNQEFYLTLEEILFFETEGEQVYAHTGNDAFRVRHRLYELETMLSKSFVRAAKGTIVNTARIYAIHRNLTASSQIQFIGTHKHVYVSRHYYKALREKMEERGMRNEKKR